MSLRRLSQTGTEREGRRIIPQCRPATYSLFPPLRGSGAVKVGKSGVCSADNWDPANNKAQKDN